MQSQHQHTDTVLPPALAHKRKYKLYTFEYIPYTLSHMHQMQALAFGSEIVE